MVDIVSPEKRSRMMAGITGKNTKPEILVRKGLFARGLRFRLHNKDLPGKPDIVLPKYKVAIQIHGCFWHGHKDCHLFRLPKSRKEFWINKIEGNKKRDNEKEAALLEEGWRLLVIWECALKGKTRNNYDDLIDEAVNFIKLSSKEQHIIRGNLPDTSVSTIR